MKRREFITLLGGAVTSWPLPVRAQQTGMPVIGILSLLRYEPNSPGAADFRQALAEAGYVPGQNIAIVARRTNNPFSLPRLAAELVDSKVNVILTSGSPYAAVAAKDATTTTPIVFQLDEDPLKYGLVTSLSRPGGNVTGVSSRTTELAGKRLSFLIELIPQATTIAYLSLVGAPISEQLKSDMLAAGRALGREIIVSEVRGFDLGAAFRTLVEQRADALVVGSFTAFLNNRHKIVELAARHKIATMYPGRLYVAEGGLISYGPTGFGNRQLVRDYVVPILKGAKPADLPVRQPTHFGLAINLNTANALGLTIPRTVSVAVTEWIE